MKTLTDLLKIVYGAFDLPLQLGETRQEYIQAHKCLIIFYILVLYQLIL